MIALIGLVAGTFGGLAGVGGSILILPLLHFVFSPAIFGEPANPEVHHMYMAAAMAVNVAVSLPAAMRHHREGAVRMEAVRVLVPWNAVAVIGGVLISNMLPGEVLQLMLAVILVLYGVWNARLIIRPRRRKFEGQGRVERFTTSRLAACGVVTGIVGGLVGLGGGFLMVPLLQILCNMRLKNAIPTSSAVLCVTAAIGAVLKGATLTQHGQSVETAAIYALLMTPTGVIGALAGAKWLHLLPVTYVRTAMIVLIFAAATRLLP